MYLDAPSIHHHTSTPFRLTEDDVPFSHVAPTAFPNFLDLASLSCSCFPLARHPEPTKVPIYVPTTVGS